MESWGKKTSKVEETWKVGGRRHQKLRRHRKFCGVSLLNINIEILGLSNNT